MTSRVILAGPLLAVALQSAPATQSPVQPPTFRSGVDLVAIEEYVETLATYSNVRRFRVDTSGAPR